jgi:hypothetical protein
MPAVNRRKTKIEERYSNMEDVVCPNGIDVAFRWGHNNEAPYLDVDQCEFDVSEARTLYAFLGEWLQPVD